MPKTKYLLLGQFLFNLLLFFLMLAINDFFPQKLLWGVPLLWFCWFCLALLMTSVILLVSNILLKENYPEK